MKKFNVQYVKQHPVMFGAIFLVFGIFLWMLLNRGAGASGSSVNTTVVTPGPSDAQIAAGAAVQQAQLESNTQIALAQLSLSAHHEDNQTQAGMAALALQQSMAEIQAQYNLGKAQLEGSVAALSMQLANSLAITNSNNSFMLDYAKNAQDAATSQLMIGASLQAQLSQDQLKAFQTSALVSAIPSLNKGDRDQALIYVSGVTMGDPNAAAAALNEQTHGAYLNLLH